MNSRVHIFVSGKVQGVFFRVETVYQAKNENVTGWVRNRSDGRVEAIFEGNKKNVEKMVDFCKKGPKGAIVKSTEVTWEEYIGESQDFQIFRTVFF